MSLRKTSQSTVQISFENKFADWMHEDVNSNINSLLPHFLMQFSSQHTKRNYARDIVEFLEFVSQVREPLKTINQINERMLLSWMQLLQEKHSSHEGSRRRIANASIARKLSSVSSFLSFAHKRKLIDSNPAELILRPKIKRESKTNAFSESELKILLDYLARQKSLTHLTPRKKNSFALAHAVLSTLFSVGMRVDELCELRIGDLEILPDGAKLHMTAKGGKHHSPYIHEATVLVLQTYVNTYRRNALPSDFLFVRVQNTKNVVKLTQGAVYDMVVEHAKNAGIEKKVSPHSCRATLATLLHKNSVPIGEIQELLGHSQITTTAIYLKKSQEKEEAAALKINILGR